MMCFSEKFKLIKFYFILDLFFVLDKKYFKMDVFLMIRRQNTTIFVDAKETTTVLELKKMIEGILKRSPEDQRLFKITKDKQIIMDESKQVSEYGYLHTTARAQLPEMIGLAIRIGNPGDKEEFETLDVTPFSTPPDLPDVMKGDSSGISQQNMDSNDK